jgi:hypothetical protein
MKMGRIFFTLSQKGMCLGVFFIYKFGIPFFIWLAPRLRLHFWVIITYGKQNFVIIYFFDCQIGGYSGSKKLDFNY